jgi:flagellin
LNDVATNLKSLIDAASLPGVTVTANTVANPTTSDVTLDITKAPPGSSITLAVSDSYASKDFDYVAGDGDTLNDVVANLKSLIDAANLPGVTVTANSVADPTTTDVALDIANTAGGQVTLAVEDNSGGTAGGGLFALAGIDVSTETGVADGLTKIESMIQVSIDAAASFGAAQKRVEIQNDFVSKLIDSLKAGIGILSDANMEEASARLQALQVQRQLSTQALAIANQSPRDIVALFDMSGGPLGGAGIGVVQPSSLTGPTPISLAN